MSKLKKIEFVILWRYKSNWCIDNAWIWSIMYSYYYRWSVVEIKNNHWISCLRTLNSLYQHGICVHKMYKICQTHCPWNAAWYSCSILWCNSKWKGILSPGCQYVQFFISGKPCFHVLIFQLIKVLEKLYICSAYMNFAMATSVLIQEFFYFHADDPKKTEHLLSLDGAKERLHLFKANLLEEGSFDSIVEGCVGVFHTASPFYYGVTDPQVHCLTLLLLA